MYEAYFNLQRRPFSATPDSSCFFAPEAIQEILDQLVLRAESGEGIGVVTGAAGTGKTLLCRRIASELTPRMTPVFLANSNFPTRRALLQSILFELGRKYSGLEEQELRLAIFGMLRELTLVGRGAVLIVDEAHLLSDRLLEELRLLACLAEEGQPLARVILAGQPALEERLVASNLEALNQRIACHLYLEPLSRRESVDYIDFRVAWAGSQTSRLFEEAALENIAAASAGLPRCLNQLCDHSLLLTYVQEQPRVTAEIVEEALYDLRQLPLHWNTPVTADTPLAALNETGAEDESDCDLEDETDVVGSQSGETSGGADTVNADTVCFEVGGYDDEETELEEHFENQVVENELVDDYSESISLADDDQRTVIAAPLANLPVVEAPVVDEPVVKGPVVEAPTFPQPNLRLPFPAAITWQAILPDPTEEPLVDRYASLDAKMPRMVRTFEDAPVPENWQLVPCSDVPAAPEPPALESIPGFEEIFSIDSHVDDDLVIEPATDLRSVVVSDDVVERDFDETVDFLPAQPVAETVNVKSQFVAANSVAASDVHPEIEDLLQASVLEACREVQAAVGRWHEEEIPSLTASGRQSLDEMFEDVVLPEPVREYDVVEPATPVNRQIERDVVVDEQHPAIQSTGRYVPKPKYRMIFSTLRRRLGRGR